MTAKSGMSMNSPPSLRLLNSSSIRFTLFFLSLLLLLLLNQLSQLTVVSGQFGDPCDFCWGPDCWEYCYWEDEFGWGEEWYEEGWFEDDFGFFSLPTPSRSRTRHFSVNSLPKGSRRVKTLGRYGDDEFSRYNRKGRNRNTNYNYNKNQNYLYPYFPYYSPYDNYEFYGGGIQYTYPSRRNYKDENDNTQTIVDIEYPQAARGGGGGNPPLPRQQPPRRRRQRKQKKHDGPFGGKGPFDHGKHDYYEAEGYDIQGPLGGGINLPQMP